MKLYREVNKKEFGDKYLAAKYKYDGIMHVTNSFINNKEIWLEPIEITEEEIMKVLQDFDVKPSYAPTIAKGDTTPMITRLAWIGDFRGKVAKAIIQKLTE